MLILDRYILLKFISTLIFAIVALCVIFLVVNMLENLDSFLDQKAGIEVITKYYLYFFPEILKLLTPVATLLATLFTIGGLSTSNEITAMKSGGLSLYRLMLPLVVFSIVFSCAQLYFNGWIVPEANSRKLNIERVYLKKIAQTGAVYDLYFRDTPLRNVSMQYYNSEIKEGRLIAIEYFTDNTSPRLTRRIEAQSMNWSDSLDKWQLKNVIDRSFHGTNVVATRLDSVWADLTISHGQIMRLQMTPEEMNVEEFREYIDLLQQGGKDVSKQMIDYHAIFAFPFANFIVVLFGVPFASVRKRGGIALQIGAAMVISFAYMIFIKFSQTLGYSMHIDPIVSAWFANAVFFLAGLIVIFRTKT